jgi:hypothetical protein
MKNYRQILPRKVNLDDRTPLCQHLDFDTGDSCDKNATVENSIFEADDTGGGIHIIFLCYKHADLRHKNI